MNHYWISVKDQLPPENETLLVYVNFYHAHEEADIEKSWVFVMEASYNYRSEALKKMEALRNILGGKEQQEEKEEKVPTYNPHEWVFGIPFKELNNNEGDAMRGAITHWCPMPKMK